MTPKQNVEEIRLVLPSANAKPRNVFIELLIDKLNN